MFRLVFWGAVLVWAVFKIRDLGLGNVAVPELLTGPPVPEVPVDVRIPLPRPTAPAPPSPAAAPAAGGTDAAEPDLAAVLAAMNDAVAAAGPCGATGELGVSVGPGGLADAWLAPGAARPAPGAPAPLDAATTACLAGAVWSRAWPSLPMAVEFSGALAAAPAGAPVPSPAPAPK